MATRLDISQLRGRAPSRRTDSSRKWQVDSGGQRAWIALELLPEAFVADADRRARWLDVLEVEPRPGLARWEVFERVDPTAARGLGIAGEAIIAARPWVEGRSLGRSATVTDWLESAAAVAMSLRELHDQGGHHGGLKPANIVMDGPTSATITDLPLSPAPYDDPTRLASLAPYLAPECWEGDAPTSATDIYALGVMICEFATGRRPLMANGLSGWSKAHTSGAPRIEHLSDTGLTGLVDKMLSKEAVARPTADDVVRRLVDHGADLEPPPISPLTSQVRRVAHTIVGRMADAPAVHLAVARDARHDAARRLSSLVVDRLQLQGEVAMRIEGSRPEPGWPWIDDTSAWSTLIEIARTVARLDGRTLKNVSVSGDRQHVEREFIELIVEQLPPGGLRVVWQDFDDEIIDVRRIWRTLVDESVERGRPLSTLTVTDEPMPHAEPVDIEATAAAWDTWRRNAARGDVRRMSSSAWREILSEGAPGLDAMQVALDRQLGNRRAIESTEEPDDPAAYVQSLIGARAFDQACRISRQARSQGASAVSDTEALERLWIESAANIDEPTADTRALEDLLVGRLRHDARRAGAAVDLARVRLAQDRPLEALKALNSASPADAVGRARIQRWKAQANLDAGRYDDAADAADAGLDELAGQDAPELRRDLELLSAAARAAAGHKGASDHLESGLAEHGAELGAREKAQFYRCLGRSHMMRGSYDDAIMAYRRALDIVEAADLDAMIPLHRLRLGTAYHRRGQLGLAREQYVAGLDASAEGISAETRASLHAQLAGIDETLGALDEAERDLWNARDIADSHHLDSVLVVCDLLEGELYVEKGDAGRARECYQRALQGRRLTSANQRTELHLAAADVALELSDRESARGHIEQARELVDRESLDNLRPRMQVMRAKVELADGQPSMSAIEAYRKGLEGALDRHDLRQVLRHAPALLALLEDEGIGEVRAEVAEIYARARRSVSTGLTRQLRERFEEYVPEIVATRADEAPPRDQPAPETPEPSAQAPTGAFRRLLGFNGVLFGAQTLAELAEGALDVANSLLTPDCVLVLVDEQQSSASAGGLGDWPSPAARSVAGEVARIGQSTAVDTASDPRFGAGQGESPALQLEAWPIRDRDGVVGALMLGRLADGGGFDRDLVEALAHQLALATRSLTRAESLARRLAVAEERVANLEAANRRLRAQIDRADQAREAGRESSRTTISSASKVMESFEKRLAQTASRQMSVEIVGPRGSRRERYGRAIHERGARRDGPFIVVDCDSFDPDSLEVELFGEVTSRYERRGAMARAGCGTLFLGRIDRVPRELQAKLYRALESGSVRPLGADDSEPVDVRLVCGTEVSLATLVERGEFDANLGHWIGAERLSVPALSERPEDIPMLANRLLAELSNGLGRRLGLSPEASNVLQEARWPGDVRQLEGVVRAAATLFDGEVIDAETVQTLVDRRSSSPGSDSGETRGRKPKATRADVITAMRRAEDDRSQAAEILGVSERTLYRYLKRYEIR